MKGRSGWITFFAVAAATAFGAVGTAAAASGVAHPATAPRTSSHLTYHGTVNLGSLAAGTRKSSVRPTQGRELTPLNKKRAAAALARTANPNPSAWALANETGTNPFGFVGLTAADSGQLNALDVEPPDQGLCAHGNNIIETVNLALDVYSDGGARLIQPVSLNAFFGMPPVVGTYNGHTTYGPFLSDPRCLYDQGTHRWFVTALEIDTNPYTGAFGYRSSELIAVSQTSDPTGNYALFSLDSTNDGTDGTPSQPNCPCLGDQPRIGADTYGFYISDDSYSLHNSSVNGNGGMLYVIPKQALAAAADGGPAPYFLALQIGATIIQGYPANAVQPAETPQGGSFPSNREYFLSTPDFNGFATSGGQGASAVVLWTLLNTSSLNTDSPSVTLTDALVPSEPFTPPVNAPQKPGFHPLGTSLGEPVEPLNVDDDRMQQVEFVNHLLYSSLETGVGAGTTARTGDAWFAVQPSSSGGGTVSSQGYLAGANGASLMYPAIGLNAAGAGVMTFSVSGHNYYPSAAYVPFNGHPRGSTIIIHGPGTLPEDGFTCYPEYGFGPPCRWGDYSAASSDGAGHIVMGDEMTTNVQRDQLANWDTYVGVYTPPQP